jgi:chaperonin GroEL (HSP60 family)
MPHKRILFRSEARERLLRGAATLADAVRVTLGPKSKCVLIEKKWGQPLVCNDGVTIVKEIELEDPEENLGAHMLREAAERTADVVGDGTTTATLLAHAIFAAGLRNLAAGASAVDIKRGLDRGLGAAVAAIRGLSRPVASRTEKAQVAAIAAHNDTSLEAVLAVRRPLVVIAEPADLGSAAKVTIDRDTTTIIGGTGDRKAIEARCGEIRRRIKDVTSDYDREKLEERLAKLAGGVAIIRVGAPTEAELKSRKEALDDAISATRAAIAEGIVPGGGLALLRATAALDEEERRCDGDERTGVRILRQALEVPARTIAENSAADGGVVVGDLKRGTGAHGFDAARGVFCDLVEAGIVDPTKVVRTALENAVSVAGTLLLTEATLTEVKEEPSEKLRPEFAGEV